MNLVWLLAYTALFGGALYGALALFGGTIGWQLLALIVGGFVLALLWMLAEKLSQIDKKLDELLKTRDEHDKQ